MKITIDVYRPEDQLPEEGESVVLWRPEGEWGHGEFRNGLFAYGYEYTPDDVLLWHRPLDPVALLAKIEEADHA